MVARSPNYPAVDLGTALAGIATAYEKETRNKMSRAVLAKHLGYNSLNGRALGKIGAVRAYGLVDGSGDDLRVSDIAIAALKAPAGSDTRKNALEAAATKPPLFQELRAEFPDSLPSLENIEFWLAKRSFTGKGAGKAAQTYLTTMRLVSENPDTYNPSDNQEEPEMQQQTAENTRNFSKPPTPPVPPRPGMLQEVFTLEEGPVTLSFPSTLSEESYQDLADHMAIFLRKAKRRAEMAAAVRELIGDDDK